MKHQPTTWQERDAAADLECVIEDLFGVSMLLHDIKPTMRERAAALSWEAQKLLRELRGEVMR